VRSPSLFNHTPGPPPPKGGPRNTDMFYPRTTIVMVLLAGILGYHTLPPPVAQAWILDPSARVLAHANRIVHTTRWTWIDFRAGRGNACALFRSGLQRMSPTTPRLLPREFLGDYLTRHPERAHYMDPAWLTGIASSPQTGLEFVRRGLQRDHAPCPGVSVPDSLRWRPAG